MSIVCWLSKAHYLCLHSLRAVTFAIFSKSDVESDFMVDQVIINDFKRGSKIWIILNYPVNIVNIKTLQPTMK